MSEHNEQVALFKWAKLQEKKYPCLRLMFAIPNGGHRHKLTAMKLKAEGVKAGVLDVFLPVPMQKKTYGFNTGWIPGLWIEMKYGKNKLTEEQKQWKADFEAQGFQTALCYSWVEAKDTIINYLSIGRN